MRYSVTEVFSMIGDECLLQNSIPKGKKRTTPDHSIRVDGVDVYRKSLRYMTFYQKGCKCVSCGKQGTHFRLTVNGDNPNRGHFNLYCEDGSLMTKDHIVPRSKGGEDNVNNLQPMCERCNVSKGNSYDGNI